MPNSGQTRFQPVIEALAAIQRNLTTHQEHFSEQVPIEGVVTPRWKEKVFEQVNGETKINRRYYELCVLERLERALKCKEVWVEGSYDFRNPSEDLPSDWSDEQRRTLHYQALGKPLDAQAFIRLLRTRMETARPLLPAPISTALSEHHNRPAHLLALAKIPTSNDSLELAQKSHFAFVFHSGRQHGPLI